MVEHFYTISGNFIHNLQASRTTDRLGAWLHRPHANVLCSVRLLCRDLVRGLVWPSTSDGASTTRRSELRFASWLSHSFKQTHSTKMLSLIIKKALLLANHFFQILQSKLYIILIPRNYSEVQIKFLGYCNLSSKQIWTLKVRLRQL